MKPLPFDRALPIQQNQVTGFAINREGSLLLSSSSDSTVRVWDLGQNGQPKNLKSHTGWVTALRISPNSTYAISGSADGSIIMWDLLEMKEKRKLPAHQDEVIDVDISQDSQRILTVGADRVIRILNANTGKQECELETDHTATCARFHSNCVQIFFSSTDCSIHTFDIPSNSEGSKLCGHTNTVNYICLDVDGTRLYSSSDDKTIRIWQIEGEAITNVGLMKNQFPTVKLALSNDGKFLASTGRYQKNVKVWNCSTFIPECEIEVHSEEVTNVAFRPQSTSYTIISSSRDSSVVFCGMTNKNDASNFFNLFTMPSLENCAYLLKKRPFLFSNSCKDVQNCTLLGLFVYFNRQINADQLMEFSRNLKIPITFKEDDSRLTPLQVAQEMRNYSMLRSLLRYCSSLEEPNYIQNVTATVCTFVKEIPNIDISHFLDSRKLTPLNRSDFPSKGTLIEKRSFQGSPVSFLTPPLFRELAREEKKKTLISWFLSAISDSYSSLLEKYFVSIKYLDLPDILNSENEFLSSLAKLPAAHNLYNSQTITDIIAFKSKFIRSHMRWFIYGHFIFCLLLWAYMIYIYYHPCQSDINRYYADDGSYLCKVSTLRWVFRAVLYCLDLRLMFYWVRYLRFYGLFGVFKDWFRVGDFLLMVAFSGGLVMEFFDMRVALIFYCWANVMVTVKALHYMRFFKPTAFVINVLFESCYDMIAFTFLAFIMFGAFAVSMLVITAELEHDQTLQGQLAENFVLLLGDYRINEFVSASYSSTAAWIIFILYEALFAIILLQLIIVVIANTYDRVSANRKNYRNYAQLMMVLEREKMLVQMNPKLKSHNRLFPKFLFTCKRECAGYDEEIETWQGRMAEMRNKIGQASSELEYHLRCSHDLVDRQFGQISQSVQESNRSLKFNQEQLLASRRKGTSYSES